MTISKCIAFDIIGTHFKQVSITMSYISQGTCSCIINIVDVLVAVSYPPSYLQAIAINSRKDSLGYLQHLPSVYHTYHTYNYHRHMWSQRKHLTMDDIAVNYSSHSPSDRGIFYNECSMEATPPSDLANVIVFSHPQQGHESNSCVEPTNWV